MRAFQVVCLLTILSSNCRAGEKVVDLILVAGQSNAVGFHTRASELPRDPSDNQVMFWWKCGDPPADEFDSSSNQEWTTLRPQPKGEPKLPKGGTNYGNFGYDEGGFGPEIGLTRTLLERQPDRPLAIVKVAYSGTGIDYWNPGNKMDAKRGRNCYPALLAETKLAIEKARAQGITLRPRALVWCQGESNCMREYSPAYRDSLEAMIAALRKDLDAPKLIALIGLNTKFGQKRPKEARKPSEGVLNVVRGMKELAAGSEHVEYVDDWGCEVVNIAHFGSKGTLELGKRYAEALMTTEERINESKKK
jgi:hypothetical protein